MNESIEELRQRWERDPSPQLALHLAEEYRRQDQRHEAVEVLSRALQAHPDHMAAKVALGRYEFEMGDLAAAREHLEQVAQQDPTHLVASKLLVSLYLEAGEKKQARDRLDLYKLLNESDPDIETLEDRLEGGDRPPPKVIAAPTAVVVDVPRNGDPFKDLWANADSADYWRAIGAEGIFPVASTRRTAAPSAEPAPIPEDRQVPGTTVTLAQLYLQQGHLDDAEGAFRDVLSREPGNVEAAAGLEEVQGLRTASVAGELGPGTEAVGDATARKIEALNEYLQRIRAADRQR
jgi:tetratricopeptide (TPR) repeat protein